MSTTTNTGTVAPSNSDLRSKFLISFTAEALGGRTVRYNANSDVAISNFWSLDNNSPPGDGLKVKFNTKNIPSGNEIFEGTIGKGNISITSGGVEISGVIEGGPPTQVQGITGAGTWTMS